MWAAITKTYASQSRTRLQHLRTLLSATRKEESSVMTHFSTMRGYADEMAAAGKPMEDEDVVAHILNGLDAEYNSLIEQINGMTDPIGLDDLYARLLATEAQMQIVANSDARGCGSGGGRSGNCGGGSGSHPNRGGFWRGGNNGGGRGNPNNPYRDHQCQVCRKFGHTALRCWKRFDKNYNGAGKTAAAVMKEAYNIDPTWYADSAATDHITGELDKLTMKEAYNGQDQVHVANGVGMTIAHVGQSTVHTPSHSIFLNDVLHVPQATRNLASIHRLTSDNDCFVELHPTFFCYQGSKQTLLHGTCRNGLYPLPSSTYSSTSRVYSAVKPSTERWHGRLGHPSFTTVRRVIRAHSLPCESSKAPDHVCDACQQAKSRQLPFPKSVSVSKAPVELVFSDVWGPAPSSAGSHSYYVSFIEIIVSLHGCSFSNTSLRCFKSFIIFKLMLNVFLISKFSLCKPIGEASTKN